MTARQLARTKRVNVSAIYQAIRRGQIKAHKVGREWAIGDRAADAYQPLRSGAKRCARARRSRTAAALERTRRALPRGYRRRLRRLSLTERLALRLHLDGLSFAGVAKMLRLSRSGAYLAVVRALERLR